MFIGYSPTCKGFCLEQSKTQYEKRLHSTREPHSILSLKSFKTDCKDYILDIQKTWGDFDKSIQSFFSKLRTDLDTIEKKMLMKRLPQQQLRTAVNSNDEKLIDLSRKVFNEKYDKLTCEEISRFIKIKEGQEKSGEYLHIGKREEDLAYDLMDQIKQVVYSLGKELLINRKRAKEQKGDDRGKNKREDHREERINTKKESTTTSQRRQGRDNREDRRVEHRERKQPNIQRKDERDERKRVPQRETRDGKESDYRKWGKQQRPWRKDRQASETSTKKTQKLRIVDLDKSSSDFSIELKIEGFIKSLKEDQVWRARDETGQIKLLIPHLPQLAKGSQVTITNCFTRQHGTELQLRVRRDSEISIQGVKQKISAGELYGNTNKHQRRERTFQSQGYPKFTKINDLTPNLQALKMIAKVISVKKIDKVIQCLLGDETGTVNARFQVGAELLKQNSSIYFRGLETEVEQDPKTNEGGLILTGGKRLLIEIAREPVGNVKFSNYVSDRKYKAVGEEDDE